jgi:hypothetical protein
VKRNHQDAKDTKGHQDSEMTDRVLMHGVLIDARKVRGRKTAVVELGIATGLDLLVLLGVLGVLVVNS